MGIVLELVDHDLVKDVGGDIGHGGARDISQLDPVRVEDAVHVIVTAEQVVHFADAGEWRDSGRRADALHQGLESGFDLLQGSAAQADPGGAWRVAANLDDAIGVEVSENVALELDGGPQLCGAVVGLCA